MLLFCSRSALRTNQKHCKKISRRSVSRVLSTFLRMLDGHSSGTCFAARLARPTRAADRKYSRFHVFTRSRPPLFGLAPGGVYPAGLVTKAAVRSYRPVSPFPGICMLGGLFSVALSLGSPPPAVSRHRISVEPGLSSTRVTPGSGRPTVWIEAPCAYLRGRVKPIGDSSRPRRPGLLSARPPRRSDVPAKNAAGMLL